MNDRDVLADLTRLARHIHVTLIVLLLVAGVHLGLVTATAVGC